MIIVAVVKVELHGRLKGCTWPPQGVHMAASRGAHGRLKGCTWPPQGVHMAASRGAHGRLKGCTWDKGQWPHHFLKATLLQ